MRRRRQRNKNQGSQSEFVAEPQLKPKANEEVDAVFLAFLICQDELYGDHYGDQIPGNGSGV